MQMFVENKLVQVCIMDRKNVSDSILFAEAQSCALLKEYAKSFFLLHARRYFGLNIQGT
jgi:hypothetical protein